MAKPQTLTDCLDAGADSDVALVAPDRDALTFAALRQQVGRTIEQLNALGIGRNDAVGIVLPNGPEMAAAFVAVAAAATAAPLNPNYRDEEFRFYLEDLDAKAVIVAQHDETPAREAADALDIRVLELAVPSGAAAGEFALQGDAISGGSGLTGRANQDDIALVLHTSGTTSRPKIVPLSHRNVAASARNIAATLQLTPQDRYHS